MKIRSITYFCNPHWPVNPGVLRQAGTFIKVARPAFEECGIEVQTTRLATVAFPRWLSTRDNHQVIRMAQEIERRVKGEGFEYVSLGPAMPDDPQSYAVIPEILAVTEGVFASGILSAVDTGISLAAVRACAENIQAIADLSPDGFANLRFAALANVGAGSPFFPAAYHDADQPAFALAMEAADLAVQAIERATSLLEARQSIISALEQQAKALAETAALLSQQFGTGFAGIDFTLAPFPEASRSIGTAIEKLGVPAVGMHGSLAAVAFLADAIDRARFPRTGFSGLMLPVLEDAVLAQRAGEGQLSVPDLLLYSAVCGTGLDTIPLPGDSTCEAIAALLLDLAALAQRLGKPLTARLLPIPGKKAGEATDFDFPYFANSRVMSVKAEPLKGLLTNSEVIGLLRR